MIRAPLIALVVLLAAVGASAYSPAAELWIGVVLSVAGALFVVWGGWREWVQQRDAVRAQWRRAEREQARRG